MNWLKEKVLIIKRYLPDALIFTGVFLFSINYFQEKDVICLVRTFRDCMSPDWGIITGIMAVVIGVDLLARRYFQRFKM